jgi:hypothetical protein
MKSVAGFEEAALSAEKTLDSFNEISSLHFGNANGKKRDALLKEVDHLRKCADRAREGFTICYDKDLAGASDEDDVGIYSLMHYSGRIGDSIIFNCREVECGNLCAAMRENGNNYLMKLSFDCDDPSTHNGWFCFSMRNLAPNKEYKICIINLTDSPFTRDHLGSHQFKVMGYSSRLQRWKTVESRVILEEGSAVQPAAGPGAKYLKFTMTFRFTESWVVNSEDSITLAAAVPYSQRDLASLVSFARSRHESCSVCHVTSLCRTPMGNDLVAFTITAPAPPSQVVRRRTLIFCARARACVDTASSWASHGLVAFLCAGSADARALLKEFVFVVIPMMNADGVAAGHSHLAFAPERRASGCSLWNAWGRRKSAVPLEVRAIKLFVQRSMDAPGGSGKASTRPRPAPLLFCELMTTFGRGGVSFSGVRNGVMSSAFYLRERTFPIAWVTAAAAAAPGTCVAASGSNGDKLTRLSSGAWLQMPDVSFPIISEVDSFAVAPHFSH